MSNQQLVDFIHEQLKSVSVHCLWLLFPSYKFYHSKPNQLISDAEVGDISSCAFCLGAMNLGSLTYDQLYSLDFTFH